MFSLRTILRVRLGQNMSATGGNYYAYISEILGDPNEIPGTVLEDYVAFAKGKSP